MGHQLERNDHQGTWLTQRRAGNCDVLANHCMFFFYRYPINKACKMGRMPSSYFNLASCWLTVVRWVALHRDLGSNNLLGVLV
jgi:hypothetical protein